MLQAQPDSEPTLIGVATRLRSVCILCGERFGVTSFEHRIPLFRGNMVLQGKEIGIVTSGFGSQLLGTTLYFCKVAYVARCLAGKGREYISHYTS